MMTDNDIEIVKKHFQFDDSIRVYEMLNEIHASLDQYPELQDEFANFLDRLIGWCGPHAELKVVPMNGEN